MALIDDVKTAYRAVARTDLNDTVAAAVVAAINAGTTTLDAYIAGLVEQNKTTTSASVAIAAFVTGVTPTSAKLDDLKKAADAQVASYKKLGVANPDLGAFEAFGKGFAEDAATGFATKYGALSTTDFINAVYNQVFGTAPSAGALANLQSQIDSFTKLYSAPGTGIANPALSAKGAVLGQIVGYAFVDPAFTSKATIDDSVATFLTAAAKGSTAGYGVALPGFTAPGQTFVLTNNPDAFQGTANQDNFVASEATLSSADVLDGAGGIDTLLYASSGAAAVNEAGFTAKNIEIFQITSDAVGGTTFDVTGASGVTTLNNSNSSTNLTLVGLANLVDIGVQKVSGGDTAVLFTDAALAGAADTVKLTLNGNVNNSGKAASTVSLGNNTSGGTAGIETLAVTSTGAASKLVDLITGAKTITVAGDAALTVNDTLNGTSLVDASTFKGALSVKADSGALAVVVKGGEGNDTADFSLGFTAGDSFDGGAGTDTLGLTNALATGVLGGAVANVEQLNVTTAGAGTLDASKFPGVTRITYDEGLGAATDVTKAATGLTVEVDVQNAAQNLSITLATNGAADELTVHLDEVGVGDAIGAIKAADAETFNVSVKDNDAGGKGDVTIADLNLASATTLKFSGDADVTVNAFTAPATRVLSKIDASGMTDKVTLNNVGGTLADAGASITLGSGADAIAGGTGLGADTLTLGAGADRVAYTNVNQSSAAKVDTINDFKVGEDVIDLSSAGAGAIVTKAQFAGNFANFGSAQGAINAGGIIEAVFQQDTNTLWVDVNNDGTLNANDLQIVLKGVTSLTAADLGIVPGVTFTAKVNAFDTTNATHSVEGTKVGFADDVIIATAAQIPGANISGGATGTDLLRVTDDANGLALAGGLTSIEQIELAGGSTGNVTVNNAGVVKVSNTSATVGSTVTFSAVNGGTDFVGGAKNDALTLGNAIYNKSLDGGAGTDTLNVVAGSRINTATVAGFEILNVATDGGAVAQMTAAQHNAFLTINAAGFNDAITLFNAAGNAVVAGDADIATYKFDESGGTYSFTLGALAQSIDEEGAGTIANTYTLGVAGAYTGTFTDLDNLDTVVSALGTDISAVNAGAATGAGLLNLTGNIRMTEAQHDPLDANTATSNIIAAGAADQVTIATGNLATINTDADVETYVIEDDTVGNAVAVEIRGGAQTVTATSATDAVTFSFNASALTFSGTINGEGTVNDVLSLATGANLSGATINNVEDLTLANNASVTVNGATYNGFTGTITAGAAETITISSAGTYGAKVEVESYVLGAAGNDTFNVNEVAVAGLTDAVRNAMSVSLSGGGSDAVVVNNAAINGGVDASITITNFTAGAAGDIFRSSVNNVQHNAGFQEILAGGTNLTVGANSVIEINTATAEAINLLDVGAGAGIESILANSIANAASGDYTVVIYQGANAGVYQINTTAAGADLTAANTTVELVGILQNIGANAMTSGNLL